MVYKSKLKLIILLLILVSAIGCTTTNSQEEEQASKISLNELKISSVSYLEEEDLSENFGYLAEYLSMELGIPVTFEYVMEYDVLVDLLGEGNIDLAYLGPVTYVQAKEKYGGVELVSVGLSSGSPVYYSYIVAGKDSQLESISDISGKSFGFASDHSTSGHLIPRLELSKGGVLREDLLGYEHFSSHDLVAQAVISGEVDAGGIIDSVYKKNKDSLKVIKQSGPIPQLPFVAKPGISEDDLALIIRAFKKLNPENNNHLRILKGLDKGYTGFTIAKDSDYNIIREAMVTTYGTLDI